MIELPRSTYYYRSTASPVALADDRVAELITTIQDELPGYGYRRVTRELARRGYRVNHKRIARIMAAEGLGIKPRRRRVSLQDPITGEPAFYPNLYRNEVPPQIDRVWIADITYLRLAAGFCYLAVILDACSRRVVGYAISRRIDVQLTLAALESAVRHRRPSPGCIHHSDRGSQYASQLYREALERFGLRGSMSRPANPYDNAQCESFMKTLKVEQVYAAGYESYRDVLAQLPGFIDDIYNAKRLHSALGYVSPQEFERQLARKAA